MFAMALHAEGYDELVQRVQGIWTFGGTVQYSAVLPIQHVDLIAGVEWNDWVLCSRCLHAACKLLQ